MSFTPLTYAQGWVKNAKRYPHIHIADFYPSIDFLKEIGYTSEATFLGRTPKKTRSKSETNQICIRVPICAQKLEPMCYNSARGIKQVACMWRGMAWYGVVQ